MRYDLRPMRVLITGAGGMLGRDVAAAFTAAGAAVAALDRAALDVTDAGGTAAAVREHRPDVVVNCAAYTDVDRAEAEEDHALAVNGAGAGNVAAAAAAAAARTIHVSTDYVFAGDAERPYVESDTVGPRSSYGRSKLAGEAAVAAADPEAAIVRSSWLFGVNGPNFVATMLTLANVRDRVEVVSDQVGCPTWTGHLATALVDIADRPQAGGIMHAAASGSCSWAQLAVETFRLAGAGVAVVPITAAALGRPAPRPACSTLASERDDVPRLPPWQQGLASYLAAIPEEAPA